MRQFRKVYVDLAIAVGVEAAYILDALINAGNFQNTRLVVFPITDAERIGVKRYSFLSTIKTLEKEGYVQSVPGSKPMRIYLEDKCFSNKPEKKCEQTVTYEQKPADSEDSYMQKPADTNAETCTSICRNQQTYLQKPADTTIKRHIENNRELVESKNINNNQPELDSLIFEFFINRGYSKAEAQKFIQYNKETKGKDHLNHDNYQTLGKMWIDNIRRKPKRAEVSSMRDPGRSDYKTAGEIARERGITVDEVLDELFPDIEKTKWDPEHQFDNDEDLIEVVFWEGFGEG